MRPCIFNRRLLTNYYGLHLRRFGSQSIVTEKISVILSTKAPKRRVLEELNQQLATLPGKLTSLRDRKDLRYGAAVFASRDFATWLQDESFMSGLLETLFKSNLGDKISTQDVDVLSAVTDGLTQSRLFGGPQTGLSILYGSASFLPDLWNPEDFGSNVNQDRESSVSFLSNPLAGDTRPLEITLPLANTIFQTGRRSTLFASKWKRSHNGSMTLATMEEKRTQRIRPHDLSADHTRPLLPLLPLTPPRKIVAGLGNIVRQVEVDGSVTPASKELESLIPKVFDARSKRDGLYSPGPIGVWCWVLPPHVLGTQDFLDLGIFQAELSQSEAEVSLEAMGVFSKLISSGCRLHKILSGGGGWGLKQGLLSLDPETTYSLPDEGDVEMFIKAFQERHNPNPSEGLVTPGSYLMFCTEPHCTEKEIGSSPRMTTSTTAISVAPDTDQELDSATMSEEIEVIDGHFGVASKAGFFLKVAAPPQLTDGPTKPPRALTTKVDLPRASLLLG
ncbi:hypothetical protein AAE478_002004 [Parahypoxylon ruwenzoriense]